jgi:hypothetical protein
MLIFFIFFSFLLAPRVALQHGVIKDTQRLRRCFVGFYAFAVFVVFASPLAGLQRDE